MKIQELINTVNAVAKFNDEVSPINLNNVFRAVDVYTTYEEYENDSLVVSIHDGFQQTPNCPKAMFAKAFRMGGDVYYIANVDGFQILHHESLSSSMASAGFHFVTLCEDGFYVNDKEVFENTHENRKKFAERGWCVTSPYTIR